MSTGKSSSDRRQSAKESDLGATVVGTAAGEELGATVVTQSVAPRRIAAVDDPDATQANIAGDNELAGTAIGDQLAQTGKLTETGKEIVKPAVAKSSAGKSSAMSEEKEKSSKSVSQIGDYKIVRKLGKGGMGEVFLAHQISLDRTAALKVLSKQLAGKEDFIKRFYREARAMAKIDHPNAVRVYEVCEDLGLHYVAMEYVDGKSMQKWMDELGKLSIGDAVHVILRCAEALQSAHAQNMIHRDIKPDNVMMTAKGGVKVADFGLAKALDDDLSMTQSGTGLGTPYYMAPEQARNAKYVDGRADIYALGVTFYYFVTGSLPFTGNSTIEVIQNKELGKFTPARKLNPQVSERLELIIDKMMLKDVEHRFKDCNELIKALAALGLESPSLSFIDAPDKVVATSSAAAARSMTSTSQASRTAMPKSSAEDAAANREKSLASSDVATWFVQYKNSSGQDAIGKFSAAQIVQMIRAGSLDPRSKAKKGATGTFLPMTQIAEFERAAQSQMVRLKAETKSEGLAKQFAKIEKQQRWWKTRKKIVGFFSGAFGLVKFLIWLAVVFGGIAAAIYFAPSLLKMAKEKIDEQNATRTTEPGEKPAETPAQ